MAVRWQPRLRHSVDLPSVLEHVASHAPCWRLRSHRTYSAVTYENASLPNGPITVQKGWRFSTHEMWKYLVLPYLDNEIVAEVVRNGERARTCVAKEWWLCRGNVTTSRAKGPPSHARRNCFGPSFIECARPNAQDSSRSPLPCTYAVSTFRSPLAGGIRICSACRAS